MYIHPGRRPAPRQDGQQLDVLGVREGGGGGRERRERGREKREGNREREGREVGGRGERGRGERARDGEGREKGGGREGERIKGGEGGERERREENRYVPLISYFDYSKCPYFSSLVPWPQAESSESLGQVKHSSPRKQKYHRYCCQPRVQVLMRKRYV